MKLVPLNFDTVTETIMELLRVGCMHKRWLVLMLCFLVILLRSLGSHSEPHFISENINQVLLSENLFSWSSECSRWLIAEKEFLISEGTAAVDKFIVFWGEIYPGFGIW